MVWYRQTRDKDTGHRSGGIGDAGQGEMAQLLSFVLFLSALRSGVS